MEHGALGKITLLGQHETLEYWGLIQLDRSDDAIV